VERAENSPPFRPTSGKLVGRGAERWGDAPFVVLGDERMTYAEADARSADLAKGLLASGVGKAKVPRHVAVFASQADLPQLDSGKVDRCRLAQILGERFGPVSVEDRGAPRQRSDA
jgi:non-ribosomal peptide synthetase component E (peptide arylation enzyme)